MVEINLFMSNGEIDKDDIALFREIIRGVRPLNSNSRADLSGQKTTPQPLNRNHQEDTHNLFIDSGSSTPLEAVDPEETLFFVRHQLPHSTLRKLRRGSLCSSMELDLHGLNSKEATIELEYFIEEVTHQRRCCFRLIHGKGRRSSDQLPVLKSMVNQWLLQREDVVAFCSARQKDGGSGALYVLLKQQPQKETEQN